MALLIKKKSSWNYNQQAEFLIRLGTLIEQGYTISDGLELFLKYEKEKLKPALTLILEKLQKGNNISEVLLEIQIPNYIVSFVYFSEFYGDIAKGLIDGGNLLKKTEESKLKFKRLIRYPLFLLCVLCLFMIIMYRYLFPQFMQLFTTINTEIPLITMVFITVIENFQFIILLLLLFFFLSYFSYTYFYRKKDGIWQGITISKIPLIGSYYKMIITYFFAINLSCLLKSGLSIYDSLAIFKSLNGLGYISKQSEKVMAKLEGGEKLQQVLMNDPVYLKELAFIVEHGQANGRLVEELEFYSHWLLGEIEEKVKRTFFIIQPVLFLFIGGIILLMFASILVPVFSLVNGL